jgi:ribose transport system permease protein
MKGTWHQSPWFRALVALGLILLLGCIFHRQGAFFQWNTHAAVFREIATFGMLACGLTLVIVAGGIDLSVGSVLALSAVVFSLLTLHHQLSAWLALPVVFALGSGLGALAGWLIARFRIQPFMVTMALMVFARGLSKYLADGKKVSTYISQADGSSLTVPLPSFFQTLDSKVFFGTIPVVTLLFLGCVAIAYIVLRRLRLGRYLYAIGGNASAAHLAGVPVQRVMVIVYALSGAFAALAGVCQAAQETQGDPETGTGYELDAIAMVVIGGTSLSGGRGGIGLTLIGALTIGYLQKILSINAFRLESRLMLTGAIIITAVLFQRQRGTT